MTVVHSKREPFDIYIGRPSKWGNPFKRNTREKNIEKYKNYVLHGPLMADIEELRGKVLGCWCAPLRCHGDALLELLEETHIPED